MSETRKPARGRTGGLREICRAQDVPTISPKPRQCQAPRVLRLLPISAQTWRQEIGQVFLVVFPDGRRIPARFLGQTVCGYMLYRCLRDGALLLSMTTWDGRPSRKVLIHHGGGAKR